VKPGQYARAEVKPEKQSWRNVASAAHELKSPVEAMTDLVYLLRQYPRLDEQPRNYVQQLDKELERMRHVLSQTLRVYREPANPTLVPLSDVLDTILRFYEHKIAFKQIRVERRYECDGVVKALSEDLRQVFSNLVVNALEALRLGGKLTAHIYQSKDWSGNRGTGVRAVIVDTGPGILPENRSKVFRQVFTTKGGKGTGLGLQVSGKIVQKQGGSIRFRSSTKPERSGTIFSVFLPALASSEAESAT
jgi:signal transduction histidine kinase